ncbi:hypothetical protein [Enterobacter hormaechei]|uniref:hypothetical protein n=1 Tax=Enterobacter hormaechei TaxID=158836 RepID=UPI002A74C965|nr:hypothetical protein [Enterobacter hormaechei]MDY3570243.1 hypothetical protein [Enterobacter hormaechei]
MQHKDFLLKQIAAGLPPRYDETERSIAARHAVTFMKSNPRVTLQDAINEAKRFAKHNHRPAAPERKTPIVKSRLPARGLNRQEKI